MRDPARIGQLIPYTQGLQAVYDLKNVVTDKFTHCLNLNHFYGLVRANCVGHLWYVIKEKSFIICWGCEFAFDRNLPKLSRHEQNPVFDIFNKKKDIFILSRPHGIVEDKRYMICKLLGNMIKIRCLRFFIFAIWWTTIEDAELGTRIK